ncbi:MAG TPA: serine/threonine-protein kinase [Candidatus Eisenbacteria bacterium]|nr:serine/threonine-protein kinase [Candidatus Eisenbacteria bacterium]
MADPRPDPKLGRIRRAATPSRAPGEDSRTTTKSRWGTLPPDVLQQSCKRLGIMAVIFAFMWTIPIVLNNFVHEWLHRMRIDEMAHQVGWPMPGNLIAAIGIVSSLILLLLARRFSGRPTALLRMGLGFQILQAALVSFVTHLAPVDRQNGISWLVLIIISYPAIVPSTPRTTFFVSLLIATLDPIFYWASAARGVQVMADAFTLTWQWLPTYVSAMIAVVPSSIITGLGRQVSKARDLGSYQLQELIGRGGMGEVYRARHRFLARPAAIKLVRPEAVGDGASSTLQRFRREAQAAASLRSPHTINLYDFGVTDDGVFYYVMELLEGVDLDTLVKRFGPVSAGRTIFLLRHACHSLGEAHAMGLVHRDIKPSNIFTCRMGLNVDFVKVLDFGLVKETKTPDRETLLLTAPDVTTGTPAFMAPEMALGEGGLDHRADIYALGCVAYWLLTGRLVFEAETPVKMMLQHVQAEPVPPSRLAEVEVPPELDRIVLACLSKKPEDRPGSTRELADLLASVACVNAWTKERAEEWWDRHLPSNAPAMAPRDETPMATVRIARDETR